VSDRAARVLVVGSPGAGKSTLARRLGEATGLPVRHLDDEYWLPGWRRLDPADWARRQEELTADHEWIIDGNHLATLPLRTPRATMVVLVDTMTMICAVRVVARALEVRRGRFDSLPRQVREQAVTGTRVRATKDFLPLLRLVLRFRGRDWWRVVELARAADATLVVAVAAGLPGGAALVRRRLARRGVTAVVVGPADVAGLVGAR
jgi:adenylate kinase family enzyme